LGQRASGLLIRRIIGGVLIGLVALIVVAILIWRGDILRSGLDPEVPFQTYDPPPAPDYAERSAWALLEETATGEAAVFFVHSTTYDGGDHWNAPIDEPGAEGWLRRSVLPNHAALFARSGAVSVPLYRQASLYTRLTIREDAREARAFAYQDVLAAFDAWLTRNPDGPIIIAGVEQGKHGLQGVVAIAAAAGDMQEQVQFCRCRQAEVHGSGSQWRITRVKR